jgi:hypothetical protein
MSVFDWSTTAADNDDADSNINWAEGQAPSTVNDSSRAEMARIAHWRNMLGANVTMGGTGNAYTYTTGETLTAYADGIRLLWSPNADPTGAVTINVDAIGAKKVYMPDGTQAGNGSLDADSLYDLVYDSSLDSSAGAFKIVGFPDTTLTAADYLTVANNLSDVASASTARGNIGAYGSGDNASFGTLTASGDVAIDTDTLFVDVSADKVGVNNAAPDFEMDVIGEVAGYAPTFASSQSGTFSDEETYGRGHLIEMGGPITLSSMANGAHGMVINRSASTRTLSRSGITMYVNGSAKASATVAGKGVFGFVYVSSSECYVTGDVY